MMVMIVMTRLKMMRMMMNSDDVHDHSDFMIMTMMVI